VEVNAKGSLVPANTEELRWMRRMGEYQYKLRKLRRKAKHDERKRIH
jgi:hypothetical protein